MPTIEGGVKYLLRGLVFIVYFPIQLLFRLIYFLWFYFIIKPLTWIWEKIFLPIFGALGRIRRAGVSFNSL